MSNFAFDRKDSGYHGAGDLFTAGTSALGRVAEGIGEEEQAAGVGLLHLAPLLSAEARLRAKADAGRGRNSQSEFRVRGSRSGIGRRTTFLQQSYPGEGATNSNLRSNRRE
jgi:hypothetical protein